MSASGNCGPACGGLLRSLESFENTALQYADELYRVARRLVGEPALAEDLVQETYLQAWKNIGRFEPGTNLRAWLYKIMFNTHSNLRRKSKLEVITNEDLIAETIAYEAPTPQNVTDEEVLAELEKLPRDFLIPVVLVDIEGLSYRELSDVLGIPIGTVMSRLHRGRKILRMGLARMAGEAGYAVGGIKE
jgi:RNA polymerase sigma-70 factor, ECF subfamily